MKKHLLTIISVSLLAGLTACGSSNHSRVNEKQRTPADIKISHLDLAQNSLNLRFEYRSYFEKKLDVIDCDVKLNTDTSFNILQLPEIQLDAFSIEILKFSDLKTENIDHIKGLKSIEYSLNCLLDYDKGSESVHEKSVLHLIPGSELKYR